MDKLFFLCAIILSILFAKIADKIENKKIVYISIIILSLIAGLRNVNVGIDTKAYYYSFTNGFPYSWQFEEKGFRFISTIFMNLFGNPVYLMLIFAFITNFCIISRLWDFRDRCNFTFMIFLYSFIFFIETLNIMRQFLAISIIFYFSRLLQKKKYLLFLIIVLLMTTIHKSSLLALFILVVYFLKDLPNRKKILFSVPILLTLILGIGFVFCYESDHINNYFSINNRINNINITFVYRFVIFLLSYLLNKSNKVVTWGKHSNKINLSNNMNSEFKIITLIYLIGLGFSSMGMFYFIMARFGYFYIIYELVYWGYLTYKDKNKNLNMIMISIYAIYILAIEVIGNGSGIFPYSMI